MIEVRLLYFGWIHDLTDCTEETRSTEGTTLEELMKELIQQYHELSEREKYRISVNKNLVNTNRQLANGDEIALLPPFSGG
jgi:sulfur-carrier protein